MSEQINKTTGGVWVACSERLPDEKHCDTDGEVIVKDVCQLHEDCKVYYAVSLECVAQWTHWLDTTIPIITVSEHEAIIKKIQADYGCEIRDPNGTIWEHAAMLQKENNELKQQIEGLVTRIKNIINEYDESW